MKLSMTFRNLLPVLALLLATSAFAADKANKGSVKVFEPVTVSGHQLPPGEYTLKWNGTSPSVDLSIFSQGKLVATVPARLIELREAGWANEIRVDNNEDGTRYLSQIDFAGKKYALTFGNEPAPTMSQDGSK
jgi:hypothetical protein